MILFLFLLFSETASATMGNGMLHETLPRPRTPQLFPVEFLPTRPISPLRRPGYRADQRESGLVSQTMPLVNGRNVCVFTCKLHSVDESNHLYITYIWDFDLEPATGALSGVEYCIGNIRDAHACHLETVQFVRENYEDESAENTPPTELNPNLFDQEEIRSQEDDEPNNHSVAEQFSPHYDSLLVDSNADSPLSSALNQIVPISRSGSELSDSDYRLMEEQVFSPRSRSVPIYLRRSLEPDFNAVAE